jgi:radical SAM protein with 4Fe4S-binding SPASM domain
MESHTGESLDLDTFKKLIDDLARSDVRSIVLKGGGEPTVHPRFIEMLDVLKQAGLSTGLITNGSLPRPGSREKVLECCQWVRVSLDAATAETHHQIHGTRDFARILQNTAYLTGHARQTMIGLNFVAEARNCHEMVPFAQLGQSLGAAYVTIRCVFDPAKPLPEDLRAAMRQHALSAKNLETSRFRVFLGNFTDRYLNADRAEPFPYQRCLGPNLIGIVGGDGEVYACCFLRGNKKFSFGNIAHHSFQDIWSSPRRQEVMQSVYRGECARACAGGMTANRYNTYNEILNYLTAEQKMHASFA